MTKRMNKKDKAEFEAMEQLDSTMWNLMDQHDPYTFFFVISHFCALSAFYTGEDKYDFLREMEISWDEVEKTDYEIESNYAEEPTAH
jgi:hypothetical protein